MVDTEERFKNWTRIILLIAIAVTGVFLVIFAMLGLRLNSDLSCGVDRAGPHPSSTLTNHSNQLDNAGDYILQEYNVNISEYNRHRFCFSIDCERADGERIEIINEDGAILSVEFVESGAGIHCSDVTNITDHQYIGLRCPECTNPAVECFIQEVVAGDMTRLVEENSNNLLVYTHESLAYQLYSYKNCKGLIKFFLWSYIWILVALFFVILILIGFRRFEKLIFEEIDMTKGN